MDAEAFERIATLVKNAVGKSTHSHCVKIALTDRPVNAHLKRALVDSDEQTIEMTVYVFSPQPVRPKLENLDVIIDEVNTITTKVRHASEPIKRSNMPNNFRTTLKLRATYKCQKP